MRCKHCKKHIFYDFNIWRWTVGRPGRAGVFCPKHRHYDDDGTLMDHNLCHQPDLTTAEDIAHAA